MILIFSKMSIAFFVNGNFLLLQKQIPFKVILMRQFHEAVPPDVKAGLYQFIYKEYLTAIKVLDLVLFLEPFRDDVARVGENNF